MHRFQGKLNLPVDGAHWVLDRLILAWQRANRRFYAVFSFSRCFTGSGTDRLSDILAILLSTVIARLFLYGLHPELLVLVDRLFLFECAILGKGVFLKILRVGYWLFKILGFGLKFLLTLRNFWLWKFLARDALLCKLLWVVALNNRVFWIFSNILCLLRRKLIMGLSWLKLLVRARLANFYCTLWT